jgi:hypothetical protein
MAANPAAAARPLAKYRNVNADPNIMVPPSTIKDAFIKPWSGEQT